ncbi:MAG: corrinoid protein [Anaerolineaceae bacterium]|nr:corrinoid protein [Anaerolineaceae bacterium]
MELDNIYQNVIDGEASAVESGVKAALANGVSAGTILQNGLIKAMGEVGQRYEDGDLYVPEMLVAAQAMQRGMALLKPYLIESGAKSVGTVVIGAVKGDLHDIGKNLVGVMLEGAGFEVIDLGTDVSADKFVDAVKKHNATVVGLSALLTTTMQSMITTIETFKKVSIRQDVKVVIGGAPVTSEFAKQIGADGYAPDAPSAVRLVRELLG